MGLNEGPDLLGETATSPTIPALFLDSLNYDRETGEITWLVNRGSRATKGAIAGYLRADGYRVIRLNKKTMYAHRIAWWFVYGAPPALIDHINRNPSDNRISNLRKADRSINAINSKLSARNRSGLKGVSWSKTMKKWRMAFKFRGRTVYEYFDDLEDAGSRHKVLEHEHV